jgi:hypothetical protein
LPLTVETQNSDAFFESQTQGEAGDDEIEKERARKFRHLQDKFRRHLSDVKIFRVKHSPSADTNLEILIIDKTPAGEIVGLKTKAVET